MGERIYTSAGVSTDIEGVRSYRFGDGCTAQLATNFLVWEGHSDIIMRDLPEPMDKIDAMKWIIRNIDIFVPEDDEESPEENGELA